MCGGSGWPLSIHKWNGRVQLSIHKSVVTVEQSFKVLFHEHIVTILHNPEEQLIPEFVIVKTEGRLIAPPQCGLSRDVSRKEKSDRYLCWDLLTPDHLTVNTHHDRVEENYCISCFFAHFGQISYSCRTETETLRF